MIQKIQLIALTVMSLVALEAAALIAYGMFRGEKIGEMSTLVLVLSGVGTSIGGALNLQHRSSAGPINTEGGPGVVNTDTGTSGERSTAG